MRGSVAGALVAALVAAALAVTACGGAEGEPGPEATGVGKPIAGSVAPLAQCSDWVEGTREERLVTIVDIRAQLNQAGADGPTPDLPDDDAYALLERACANDYASGFRLYKLYARGAAFSRLVE